MADETTVAESIPETEQITQEPTPETEQISTPPQTETEKIDAEAGTFFMVQFMDPNSIQYRRVTSTPPPNPLALQAVLQQIVDDMKTAREMDVANQIGKAMQQMQGAIQGVPCPHCKAPQDKSTTERILRGQVAFCAKCHQKIGG